MLAECLRNSQEAMAAVVLCMKGEVKGPGHGGPASQGEEVRFLPGLEGGPWSR